MGISLSLSLSLSLCIFYPAGSDEDQLFSLRVFSVLSSSLSHCWCDGVFLPVLTHRFWKLTLQVNLFCLVGSEICCVMYFDVLSS